MLLLGVVFRSGWAQEPALPSLHSLTPLVEALPRDTVNLLARLENTSGVPQRVSPQLGIPHDWRVLLPPEELTLEPGAVAVVTLSVLVAPDAAAGVYTFPLSFYRDGRPGRVETLFTVGVGEVRRLDVTVIEAPGLVIAGPYRVRFLVRNAGNVDEEVDLSIGSGPGFSARLQPESLRLEPGQVQEVGATIDARTDLREKQRHDLQLIARSRRHPDVQATARVAVEVVPRELNGFSAFHTFPTTVRFRGGVDTNRSMSGLGSVLSGFSVEVSGSGRLWEHDPGRFSVHLAESFDLRRHRRFVEYAHPDFRLALGDQDYDFSPLVRGGSGFGFSGSAARRVTPGLLLEGSVAAFGVPGGAAFGFGASAEVGEQLELSTHLLATPRRTVASARMQLFSVMLLSGAPTAVRVDAEYGIRFSAHADLRGDVLRVHGSVHADGGSAQAVYERRDAAFDTSAHDRTVMGGSVVLRLNEALRIQEAVPVDLQLRYHHEAEYVPDHLRESARGAPVRSEIEYGATLAGRAGPVSLSVRYDRSQGIDAAARSEDRERTLQVDTGVSLGGGAALQQSLAWHRASALSTTGTTHQHEISYLATGRAVVGRGDTFEAKFGVALRPEDGTLGRLGAGVSWFGAPAPGLQMVLGGEVHLTGSEMAQIAGSGSYRLEGGRVLDFDLRAQAYRDRAPSVRLGFGYSLPANIPLGRLSSIGEVTGIITDEAGEGLAGITFELVGLSVASGPDGRFRFPAVPAGEHYLRIRPGALAPNQLVTPTLPHGIVLSAGGEVAIELRVVEAARVGGRLRPPRGDAPVTGSSAPLGQTLAAPGPLRLQGVLVELSGGDTTYRTLTDSEGAFAFDHLLPGPWELRVHRGDWAEEYRLETEAHVLRLAPGDQASIDIDVVFEPRTIQFVDGGTLSSRTGP